MKTTFIALLLLALVAQDAPPPLIQEALALLSQKLGTTLTLEALDAWSWAEEAFGDSSLGCPQPGYEYFQVITRGYIFRFTLDGTTYDYRSDSSGGTLVFCESFAAQAVGVSVPITPENAA
ncbi:MAG: hypothetical protein K8I30_13045, partial [Anaerolineae bacterium]|nr:hypothetical protein [Anaerolineae bacterium]